MKVFFVHIPKTGGTSVKEYFGHNKPECTHVQGSLSDTSFLSHQEMIQIMYSPYTFKYYLDHRLSFLSTQPFDNAFTFTIVRNPIDRFISYYNYRNSRHSNFFPDDIFKAIHDAYIEQNIPYKVLSQLYHAGQGFGINFLKGRLESKMGLIIPFDYLNDIPELFKISKPFMHKNITENKIIEKPTRKIIDDLSPFIQSDLYFYNWCKSEYEKNRKELLKNGLPIED